MSKTFSRIGATDIDTSKFKFPNERTFREAWEVKGDAVIGVDMIKARKLFRNRMRQLREAFFKVLDVDYIRALEQGGDVKEIAHKKQQLRDMTKNPMIVAAKTPEELEKIRFPIPGFEDISIMDLQYHDLETMLRDKSAGVEEV